MIFTRNHILTLILNPGLQKAAHLSQDVSSAGPPVDAGLGEPPGGVLSQHVGELALPAWEARPRGLVPAGLPHAAAAVLPAKLVPRQGRYGSRQVLVSNSITFILALQLIVLYRVSQRNAARKREGN